MSVWYYKAQFHTSLRYFNISVLFKVLHYNCNNRPWHSWQTGCVLTEGPTPADDWSRSACRSQETLLGCSRSTQTSVPLSRPRNYIKAHHRCLDCTSNLIVTNCRQVTRNMMPSADEPIMSRNQAATAARGTSSCYQIHMGENFQTSRQIKKFFDTHFNTDYTTFDSQKSKIIQP